MLWHDQWYVWFVPKVAPSKHWVAKILVEVLVAHDLADIGKKNELELARVHWHAKKMATIQTKTNLWVMTKILVRCTLATIQTHPISNQFALPSMKKQKEINSHQTRESRPVYCTKSIHTTNAIQKFESMLCSIKIFRYVYNACNLLLK